MMNLKLSPLEQLRHAMGEQVSVHVKPTRPYSNDQICNSVSTVITYFITDVFTLTEEEHAWVSQEISQVLAPLAALRPRMVLGAVEQELKTQEYSRKLMERRWDDRQQMLQNATPAKQAPVGDWAEILSEIVLVSYPDLRSLYAASVIGSIYGVLVELGVDETVTTGRRSAYLPNSVRHIVGINRD